MTLPAEVATSRNDKVVKQVYEEAKI